MKKADSCSKGEPVRSVKAGSADVIATARLVLENQLAAIGTDRFKLLIPRLRGRLKASPDMHFHPNVELFIGIAGENHFTFPTEKLCMGPGAVCIVPRGVPHLETVRCFEEPFRFLLIAVVPPNITLCLSREGADHRPTLEAETHVPCEYSQRFADYLDDLVEISRHQGKRFDVAIRSLAGTLFALLLAVLEGADLTARGEHAKVKCARSLILCHFNDPALNVRSLAKWIGCTPQYLSHLFRRETGVLLNDYINEQRLRFAKNMLENSAMNVSEIAWAAGYADPSYFGRLFHRLTSQSPSIYRDRHGKAPEPLAATEQVTFPNASTSFFSPPPDNRPKN